MPRNYLTGAADRAAFLTCCCGWLDCDMPVGPAEETGDLVNKDLPGGLARDNLVTAAGQFHESCAAYSGGNKTAFARRHNRIIAGVNHECGARDSRQQVGDVDFGKLGHHSGGIVG